MTTSNLDLARECGASYSRAWDCNEIILIRFTPDGLDAFAERIRAHERWLFLREHQPRTPDTTAWVDELRGNAPVQPVALPVMQQAVVQSDDFTRGVNESAAMLDKMADDYAAEHSTQDSDTGAWEFGRHGEEYYNTLRELADGVRSIVHGNLNEHSTEAGTQAQPQPVALPAGMPEPVGEVLSSRTGNDTSTIDKALPSGTKLYTADQVQAMLAQGLKHVCNLWVDPETKRFVVDRCDHPLDQLVPAYIAAAHQTPAAVERKPLTDEVESLKAVGAKLANCAFNLSQRIGDPMTPDIAATLSQLQREWDTASIALHLVITAQQGGEG